MTPAAEVAQKRGICARPHRIERAGGGAACHHKLYATYHRAISDINGRTAIMRGSW